MSMFEGAKVTHRVLSFPLMPTEDEVFPLWKASKDYYEFAMAVIQLYEEINEDCN